MKLCHQDYQSFRCAFPFPPPHSLPLHAHSELDVLVPALSLSPKLKGSFGTLESQVPQGSIYPIGTRFHIPDFSLISDFYIVMYIVMYLTLALARATSTCPPVLARAVHDHRETTTYRAQSCEHACARGDQYRCVTHTVPDASTAPEAPSSDASLWSLVFGEIAFLPFSLGPAGDCPCRH